MPTTFTCASDTHSVCVACDVCVLVRTTHRYTRTLLIYVPGSHRCNSIAQPKASNDTMSRHPSLTSCHARKPAIRFRVKLFNCIPLIYKRVVPQPSIRTELSDRIQRRWRCQQKLEPELELALQQELEQSRCCWAISSCSICCCFTHTWLALRQHELVRHRLHLFTQLVPIVFYAFRRLPSTADNGSQRWSVRCHS